MPERYSLSIPWVPLSEFDLGGVLYHANYFHLYEKSRETLLHENGLPYPQFVAEGSHLAIAESHQEFLKPVFYGQVLALEIFFSELSNASVRANYSILDAQSRQLLHRAWTKLVFVKLQTDKAFKPCKLPESLRSLFLKYADANF
jgi:acyl-CoA thioester hydrolase